MNIKYYFIDEKILELLFSPKDDEERLSNQAQIANLNISATIGIANDFLVLKNIPTERITSYFNNQNDTEDSEIKAYLETDEFLKYSRDQFNSLNKIFINSQLPKLSESRRNEIEEYLLSMQESIEIMSDFSKDTASQLAIVKKAIKDEGLSPEEIKQLVTFVVEDHFNATNSILDESQEGTETSTTKNFSDNYQ